MRYVGGPFDGETTDAVVDVIEITGIPDMAYHRTYDPPFPPDPDWWSRGLPEPDEPEMLYEWHEREWVPPVIRAIRAAVREAADPERRRPNGSPNGSP